VRVNDKLETTAPAVWAMGDCPGSQRSPTWRSSASPPWFHAPANCCRRSKSLRHLSPRGRKFLGRRRLCGQCRASCEPPPGPRTVPAVIVGLRYAW
jgi:hypothetical protein